MSNELSKRAVDWHGWRWMPRMRMSDGATLISVTLHDGSWWATLGDHPRLDGTTGLYRPTMPDMDDPGTQGCVLRIIADNNARKSMADALADVRHAMGRGLKFPEALVFVLEATPTELALDSTRHATPD